jgi:DNA polymerase/3'-5' exonuclease PolX
MSTGVRLLRADALALAERVIDHLRPVCERIEIAGSLRRKKPDVGDIEICCIPRTIRYEDLFGELGPVESLLERSDLLSDIGKLIKGGPHYKQLDLGICNLDLFITTPEKWGVIFTLRTGPADFSHNLVTVRQAGGFLPSYMQVKDGRIWLRGSREVLPTPEERDVFKTIGMNWIEPEYRI